ncbi:hypothetical protein FSP39_024086 [Pinctada imbricata]|uniref:Potassium channel tetramerisation-type BTB domain-containing protein n=1 Tax=Pinctada imbricata TaxID=66713 RepID=A0AA88XXN0_PINIB|nr:hypothetical protein FSP39_024086 [Pinctada imbricata]
MTRLTTLCKYPDSMLAALFSGRHIVDKDDQGNYFLDSNGNLFGYILEFLRNNTLPPNNLAVPVYKEANYYGLQTLVERLQLKPDVTILLVKEAHRAQFPDYENVKESVIKLAMDNGVHNKVGEVTVYAFRKEFVPRAPNFNPKHGCVIESADITIGPWDAAADEEAFIRCLEHDLVEDGFSVRPHESKRKCRYYHGQNCQKFVYKVQIIFG